MRKPTVSKATKKFLQAKLVVVSLVFLISCLLFSSPSRAESPTEQVRTTVNKVLTLVKNPNTISVAQKKNLRARLAEVIYPRFDFAEMAKRSLGPHWARRTPEEQLEFVTIFAAMLGRSYAESIGSYAGRNVVYTREVEDKDYAEVDTKVITENPRRAVSINYKLYSVKNEWKVYDLVIENVSLVNNYRSQFNRVIARSSFEDLLRIMKEKDSAVAAKAVR